MSVSSKSDGDPGIGQEGSTSMIEGTTLDLPLSTVPGHAPHRAATMRTYESERPITHR